MSEIEIVVITGGLPPDDPDALPTDDAAIAQAVAAARQKGERFAVVGGLPEAVGAAP